MISEKSNSASAHSSDEFANLSHFTDKPVDLLQVSNDTNTKPAKLKRKRNPCKFIPSLFVPEIPAARLSFFTSASLRPKLGLLILTVVLTVALGLTIVPLVSPANMAELNDPEYVKYVSKSNSKFGSKLYPELRDLNGQENNLIFSPFSLSSILTILFTGTGGKTKLQLKSGLALPDDEEKILQGFGDVMNVLKSNENFTLDSANRLFVKDGFKLMSDFLTQANKYFGASAENVDFSKNEEAAALINQWIEKKTNDKIKNVITPDAINSLTYLVMVNAVYFKGKWLSQFDKEMTRRREFHLINGQDKVEVDFMYKEDNFFFDMNKELKCSILKVPYKGERLSMIFFLPTKPEDFKSMEDKFSDFDLTSYDPKRKIKVTVAIPKFKLETRHELNEPLKALGITDMFDYSKADLSKLAGDSKGLYVSSSIQKAFVEVNEEGTEAAAATAMIVMTRMIVRTQSFVCDRPFLFVIKDDLTGLTLFQGRVMDPTKN